MAAVLVNGHSLHPADDYRPVSQASSPASPAASFIIQQGSTTLPSINLSGPAYADYHPSSQPPTPTSVRSGADPALDPPPGTPFADFLRTWSDDLVADWLAAIKCAHQAPVFRANDIRGDVLLELDQLTLKEMGVVSVGDRIRIVAAVKKLRQRSSAHAHAHRARLPSAAAIADHARRGSDGLNGARTTTTAAATTHAAPHPGRRLDTARPAPLHLTGAVTDGLPRLIRDGQDSARFPAPVRPLPNPTSTSNPSAPRTIPPPPRGQPPVPNPRTQRAHLVPPPSLAGRRTPTLPEPPAFNTNQPLPNPPSSASGTSSNNSSGAPSEGRQTPSGARPLRAQSPLNRGVTRSPGEHGRSHSGSGSGSTLGLGATANAGGKPAAHPYALTRSESALANGLSPIAEGFSAHHAHRAHSPPTASSNSSTSSIALGTPTSAATPNPSTSSNTTTPTPTPYRSATLPTPLARPHTPAHAPSLDDIRRKVVKFSMPDEGKSSMIAVADCTRGAEVLERALRKLKGADDAGLHGRVETVDGGLCVDGWAVFLDEAQRTPLTEDTLLSICQAPPDAPAREHGLTLRHTRRAGAASPRFAAFPKAAGSGDAPDDALLAPAPTAPADARPGTKAYKRASSVSILSGLGVRLPELDDASSTMSVVGAGSSSSSSSPTKSPGAGAGAGAGAGKKGGGGKLRNFFGQRPPSELITTHLAEYFPFTEKKVLERTRRQSMMRHSSSSASAAGGAGAGGMGLVGRRDSIISWNPPPRSQSRFSVSTVGSGRSRGSRSPRSSILSGYSYAAPVPTPQLPPPTDDAAAPPRVSISSEADADIGGPGAVSVNENDARRMSRPHLLPPVAFPSESLAESLNLAPAASSSSVASQGPSANAGPSSRPGSRLSVASTASRRMSYITELRSKRDRSDTASMLTVDEITAEVESRRESVLGGAGIGGGGSASGSGSGSDGEGAETDDWTAVESSEADARSLKGMPEDEDEEDGVDDEEEEDEDDDDATDVTVTDDEEPGKAIMSRGERTIKWIKGALIGAGSFGKVYLGMDAATGLLMAVKQVELPSGSAPNDERKKSMLASLEREIALLKDLHHENIVQYHSSSMEDEHLNIFLEYVPGGSVTSVLRNYGAFEEQLVRNWVRQILLGLNYLHERDIIHRDIKGANILVDNKGGIKISDFGISKKIDDNLMNTGNRAHRPSLQGSVFWMAPEVVKQTAYTQKADIWSVGCLVVEMLTGEHPYPQLSQMQAIFKIGMSSKPTIPADISADAVDFLQQTFELNHEKRPSAAELLKHPWVANSPLPLGVSN